MNQNLIKKSLTTACLAGGIALVTHADTIIEPYGMLSEDFSGQGQSAYQRGKALGLSDVDSMLGSDNRLGYLGHRYTYSFTPGESPDNFTPASGTDYGNGDLATGLLQSDLTDGGTGLYRVYATWDSAYAWAMTGGPVNYSLTGENGTQIAASFDQNGAGSLGNDKWVLLGTVELHAGTSYTLSQTPTSPKNGYDVHSMKSSGVMFEPYAVIPEPSTYAAIFGSLALVGAFVYRRRIGTGR